MTEEDKKAIDTLAIIASTSKVDYEDYPNCICMKKDLILALNLIKSQQKEIEKLSNNNKRLLKKLRNRVKEVKKLTKYSLYKQEFSRLNKQLEKKDKIIDLILEEIAFNYEINSSVDIVTIKRQLKEKFEKKVEGKQC